MNHYRGYNDKELFNSTMFKILLVNFFILLLKPNTNSGLNSGNQSKQEYFTVFQIQINLPLFKMKKMVKQNFRTYATTNSFFQDASHKASSRQQISVWGVLNCMFKNHTWPCYIKRCLQSRCFFLGPITSCVVALQTALATADPVTLYWAAAMRSVSVWPDIFN